MTQAKVWPNSKMEVWVNAGVAPLSVSNSCILLHGSQIGPLVIAVDGP